LIDEVLTMAKGSTDPDSYLYQRRKKEADIDEWKKRQFELQKQRAGGDIVLAGERMKTGGAENVANIQETGATARQNIASGTLERIEGQKSTTELEKQKLANIPKEGETAAWRDISAMSSEQKGLGKDPATILIGDIIKNDPSVVMSKNWPETVRRIKEVHAPAVAPGKDIADTFRPAPGLPAPSLGGPSMSTSGVNVPGSTARRSLFPQGVSTPLTADDILTTTGGNSMDMRSEVAARKKKKLEDEGKAQQRLTAIGYVGF
jgi:hypothetical protein